MEILPEKQADGSLDEVIKIPIYFLKRDNTIIIDEDSIYEELEKKLYEIKRNPEKFLNI